VPDVESTQVSARVPRAAVAAGVLGLVGVLPLTTSAQYVVQVAGEDGDAGPAAVLLLVPALQVAGAVLLLHRRSWAVLAAASGVAALLFAFLFVVSPNTLGALVDPLLRLALPAATLCLTLGRPVRHWVADRTRA
jgi:hypothetical protein